ncbi:protein Spindly-B [Amyelois transitella]|uniref:protein Spindly-B n=1 Tax=Amyelois transitella TaxID=680683 RepID=UPI002990529E|nr:protein Spindly-B [Amyelois transitella]
MDYSTISNKSGITEADITNGELSEKYYSLKKQHENLSSSYDATKQELHNIKLSYQTTLDVLSHVNAELESHQLEGEKRRNELNNRIACLQEEITILREEKSELEVRHAIQIKKFEGEIRRLKEEQTINKRESPGRDTTELDDAKAAVASAESEAAKANIALDEARAEILSLRMRTEELVTEMAQMRIAADIRREELKAAGEREAVALADLAEARATLLQYTSDTQDLQPHAAKGNSIFAEVEDKRQEMAKNLIQMKQTNSRLRRELANKQNEIDVLLREKQTIWEQQSGASAHYDRKLIEKYEERITQLEGLCEKQRRELVLWFGKLCEPTANGWLPGVVDHLKTEVVKLRAEVVSMGAAHLASAAQARELRRKLAVLTANGNAQAISSPANNRQENKTAIKNVAAPKEDIAMRKFPVQIRSNQKVEDVKKKVAFN